MYLSSVTVYALSLITAVRSMFLKMFDVTGLTPFGKFSETSTVTLSLPVGIGISSSIAVPLTETR